MSERSEDEIRELARDILADRVFFAERVPEDLLGLIFLPLAFGGMAPEDMEGRCPFAVLGRHKTTGTAINGWPMFVEMAMWRREDVIRAHDLAQASGLADDR